MPATKLTELGVAKLKPPEMRHDAKGRPIGTIDYFDKGMPGLVLRVNYGGAKVWRALYYVKVEKDGKRITVPRTRRLGRYPNLTLKEAREAARKFDPKATRNEASSTFKQTAEHWIRDHVDEKGLRSKPEIERHLKVYVYPSWGDRSIHDLRRIDVNKLLDQIKNKHGRRQADAVLATIRGIMVWYADQDEDFKLPIVKTMKRDKRPNSDRARHRTLDHDEIYDAGNISMEWNDRGEIRGIWKACDDLGAYGVLAKVLLLTAQRLRKVAHMQWDDISADGVWTIRSGRREKGHAGKVRLPPIVIDLIRSLPRVDGNPHVFPAARGIGPINSFGELKQEIDKRLPTTMRPWVLHDLRRTARTLMAQISVPDHIAERTLGHQLQGVQAVYNRHPYFEEKSNALRQLAHRIDMIINPPEGNIVAMNARRS